MYRNPFWLFFLTLIGLITMGYTINTLMKIYDFQRLDAQIPTELMEWSVIPLTDEDFAIKANYLYLGKDSLYQGEDLWKEHYLSEFAAKEKISKLSEEIAKVWIDPLTPGFSTLQKYFPFKECFSTLFLWTIWIYFFWLGHYVKAYKQANKIQ